jgi:hypothetical protein
LDIIAALSIDQNAGYWILVGAQRKSRFIGDTGLMRYSVDLINGRTAKHGPIARAARGTFFSSIQERVTSIAIAL